VAVGRVAAYIFPSLDSMELYRVAGHPVFLPRLLLGIALTALLTFLNYRGIRISANFQNLSAAGVLALFLFLLGISAWRGTPSNFQPLFAAAPALSILLTLQIVPYFLTGFESVAKVAEERHPDFRGNGFLKAIAMALAVGALFYALTIIAVGYIGPWKALEGKRFATAIAFEQAVGARWPVRIILVMALFGLFQCFNGNFVASSRLLFAYGRRGMVGEMFARVHAKFQTPGIAVIAIGAGTLAGLSLGDAILVPVTEVGSGASALGWLATCVSFFLVETRTKLRIVAVAGALASLALVLIKILPRVPGHFSKWEWAALAIWLAVGFLFRGFGRRSKGHSN